MVKKEFSFLCFLLLASTGPVLAAFSVGQRVQWKDEHSRWGGGWKQGVVVIDAGAGVVERYKVRFDVDVPESQKEWNVRESELQSAAPLEAATQALPAATPTRALIPVEEMNHKSPAQAANPTAGAAGKLFWVPQPGAPNGYRRSDEPLGKDALNPAGLPPINVVSKSGERMPFGRWQLSAGGAFTKAGEEHTTDGVIQHYKMDFPATIEALVINSDGSWTKQFHGKRETGKWYDIGQNVVRLVGYEGQGRDWTASVRENRIMIRDSLGMWAYGYSF